jgi:drug/metabolite transporter (DMT)-like permease
MTVNTATLFLAPVLIWGSTWHAITWQLGAVAPEVSVTYRFAIASVLLAAGCLATRRSLAFGVRDHGFLAGLGLLMITVNYILIYWAETYVGSGQVAVVYSTMVFFTPIGMRIVFGTPLRPRIFVAATLGVVGVALLFLPEFGTVREGGNVASGIAYTLAAVIACAAGNLIAVRNNRAGIPTLPATVWTLSYGALFAALAVVANGSPWTIDTRPAYLFSLVYLAVFGSVIAFVAYFALLKRVGAGPSSYITVTTPVLAMLMSTFFEGYRWTGVAVFGVALALLGNWLAMRWR